MAPNPEVEERKRGMKRIGVAIAILIGVLLLLVGTNPEVGQRYPLWVRILAKVIAGGGWILLLAGLYKTIAGPSKGVLKALAAVVVAVGALAAIPLGWALDIVVDAPRSASSDHDDDWDE